MLQHSSIWIFPHSQPFNILNLSTFSTFSTFSTSFNILNLHNILFQQSQVQKGFTKSADCIGRPSTNGNSAITTVRRSCECIFLNHLIRFLSDLLNTYVEDGTVLYSRWRQVMKSRAAMGKWVMMEIVPCQP